MTKEKINPEEDKGRKLAAEYHTIDGFLTAYYQLKEHHYELEKLFPNLFSEEFLDALRAETIRLRNRRWDIMLEIHQIFDKEVLRVQLEQKQADLADALKPLKQEEEAVEYDPTYEDE